MQMRDLLKRVLLVLLVASLVLAIAPAVFAEGETGEAAAEEHSSEEGSILTPLGINPGLMVAQVVNFLLIAGLLSAVVWRPAVNMLDARSAKIQKGLEDAAAAAKARQNAEMEADKILAEARSERQKVLEDARQQGEEVKKQIESAARQDADRIRTEGRQDAVSARDAELASLREQVLSISSAVAGQILQENIDAKKQSGLVSNFFSKLPAGSKNLSGAVEVVSAMPLTDDEKKKVEKEISAGSYSYSVDPSILGGLIIRASDKVIDGSVRSNLSELTTRLK
jgi:F-type H+-transporting ATPase subunit b